MPVEIVLAIIAEDRPGLVQRVSEVVAGHSGNWIESSMARLGGEFAGIVRVSLPDGAVAGFEAALSGLAAEDIAITVRRNTPTRPPRGRRIRLELTGGDHPGIVHGISTALARHDISIEDLQTEVHPGSMTGGNVFSARADIVVPDEVSDARLRDDLEELAGDILVEIHLRETEE